MEIRRVRLGLILSLLVYQNMLAQKTCPVIPLPASSERGPDMFKFNKGTSIVNKDTSLYSLALFLRQSLKQNELGATKAGETNDADTIKLEKKGVLYSRETYRLQMTKRKIVISAPDQEGIFDGIISLLQLIRQSPASNSGIEIGCWNIRDTARFKWRGLMLDESRHFSGKKAVKRLLDWMAFYKLNRFHWHLTDEVAWRLEIRQYPRLTSIGGIDNPPAPALPSEYYSDPDIKEIVNYAKERFITVIPEIDMPGHATAANRAYPEFSGGGTGRFANFTFNPGKRETYSYLTNILKETAELFPSKMIHLGGDEVALGSKGWKNNPEIKELMSRENLADAKAVEYYFIHKMTDSALGIYNKVLLWDEAVDASLPVDSTIIFWWRHDLTGQLTKALQKHYDVVLCPRVPLYFDFVQDSTHRVGRKWKGDFSSLAKVYSFPDKEIDSIIGNDSHVLGIQANLWTENVKTLKGLQFLLFPRIAALSEAAWTKPTNKDYSQFLKKVRRHLLYYQKEGIYYYNPFDPGKTPEIDSANVIMDIAGYPQVFELNIDQEHTVQLTYEGRSLSRNIKLIAVRPHFEPYPLLKKGPPEIYSGAEVELEVSGKRITLFHRPYQMPVEFNGLRLYVEALKEWALSADIADLKGLKGAVRLSVCAAGAPWGSQNMIFPISGYRWKAGVYQNTWSALVPYNLRYYHRGEDYGAIPDRLDVVAPFDGKIIGSPLPGGDGESNAVLIQNKSGIVFRVAHMDLENIREECKIGRFVRSGARLGKTGMTWSGRKSQINDSHCHVELQYNGIQLASYPYLMEAYLRSYRDKVIAVAGGYQFADMGGDVVLDGMRSIARKGETIKSYAWKLHDGEIKHSSKVVVQYPRPGLYTEELMVKTLSGAEDRDFVQIRVFDSAENKRNIAFGWAAYDPVREIHPNTKILFWNRLIHTKGPVLINFGDSSETAGIDKEIDHAYRSRGRYVVTLSSTGDNNEPVTIKMEVVVE